MKSSARQPVDASSPPSTGSSISQSGQTQRRNFLVGWWRAFPRGRWWFIGVAVILIALRAMLPYAIERYVNQQLNRSPEYGGRIGTVTVQLWHGRYLIKNPTIFKRNGLVHVPLFSAESVYMSIDWRALFHGSVKGEVIMTQPRVNFVSAPTQAQAQSGKDEDWGSMLKSLFPFDINTFQINDGEIHFQNQYSTPPVDISLDKFSSVATNLTNTRGVKGQLPSGATAKATTLGGGELNLQLQFNPLKKVPDFQLVMQLTNVNLVMLNNFLKAYGKFDVDKGEFSLFCSMASTGGNYDGYLKVFFKGLSVFAWEKERKENALQVFWDAIVGTLTTVLKNQRTDTLATRVPFYGSFQDKKIGLWTSVSTLLRNAFIRALIPKLDQKVTLQTVGQHVKEQKKLGPLPPPEKGAKRLEPGPSP
jgi:Domain of Unknown Function (DUF748)